MLFPTNLAKKGMLLRTHLALILAAFLLLLPFVTQVRAQSTWTNSLTAFVTDIGIKNMPPANYNAVVLQASSSSPNGADLWVNADVNILTGSWFSTIFTSMTWTNSSSTRVTSSLVGVDALTMPVSGRFMNIQNLSLYNVALDLDGITALGQSPVQINFRPPGGVPTSLTMSNSSIDAFAGLEGYVPSAFTLTASGASNQINNWNGIFGSATTMVVTNGATLLFNLCGNVSYTAAPSERLNFTQSGNALDIGGAGSTLVISNSALQFYTNDLSSSMRVHDGGEILITGPQASLRLPRLTLDNGTLWMDRNTIVSLGSELLLTNNSTVFVGDGAMLSSYFVTAQSGSSTITLTRSSGHVGLYSGDLFMQGNATLTLNGTGNMVLTNGGAGGFWLGTNNLLDITESAALFVSGSTAAFHALHGVLLIDPPTTNSEAQLDIQQGATFALYSGSKVTNNGLIAVSGQGSSFRVYGSGTLSGSGALEFNDGASLTFRATSNNPAGQGLLVSSNELQMGSYSRLSMTLDPQNRTNDRIITPVMAIAQFGEATLTLSVTNDTFLPVNTQFLLVDHTNIIPTAGVYTPQTFSGLPQGGHVRVGQNLYEIFYNDTTAGAIGGYGIVLNSIFNIYDSYWATNMGGNWTNNPYWGTLGTNIGVAPGLTSPYGGWDTATFDIRGLTSGTGTVTLNTNAQLSAMVFSNAAASYVIGGSGTITMGTGDQNPFIFNFAGNHSIGVTMNLVTNTTIFTDTGSSLTISGPIIGAGGISALGVGTLTLTGNNTYTGPTTLVGGTLQLLGTHTGGATYTVTLGNLTGTGTTTSKVNVDGGSITPGVGNTPGTLSVGSLVIGTGGTFNALIASTSNVGQVSATGSAVVGGTLNAIPVNGWNLNFGDRYQILTAGGGISGTFGTIAVPQGYRGRFLIENGGSTGVLLFAPQSYTQVAVTPNQSNVATALNTFISATSGDKQVVSTALDSLKGSAAYQQAFNAISPQFYQSLSTIAFNAANAQYNDLVQQMFGLRVAGTGFSMSGFGENVPMLEGQGGGGKGILDSKKDILRPGEDNHWGMFVDGNGIFAQANSGNMLPGYNAQSGGLITGLTYKWNPAVTTGIYAGYEGTYAKFGYPYSGSTVIDNAVRFGLLGTFGDPSGKGFYGDALVGGTYNNYTVTRSISFPDINRTATSSPGAGELDSLIAAGYNWRKGSWAFGPVSSLQYTYFGMNSFSETGAQSLDYQGLNWNTASMIYNLGGNCAYSWQATRNLMVVPQINLAWQHEFLQNPYAINGTLGGASVSNWSATPLRDTLFTGVGVTLEFRKRWNTAFFYNAAAGNSDLVSQNIFWSAGVRF